MEACSVAQDERDQRTQAQAGSGGDTGAEVTQGGEREAGTNDTNAGVVGDPSQTKPGVIGQNDVGVSGRGEEGAGSGR